MPIQRRLNELDREARQLGLNVVPEGKKLGKKDYVRELQKHTLKVNFSDGNVPKHLQYMLNMESPMLCFRFPDMSPEFQRDVWEDKNWIAEDKINGCRMIVIYFEDEGIHFYSRNLSVKDYLPVEYDNIWLGEFDASSLKAKGIKSFIIDCELLCPVTKVDTTKALLSSRGVVTETNLQATTALIALNKEDSLNIQKTQGILLEFNAFHLLEANGVSCTSIPWVDMRPQLERWVSVLDALSFNIKGTRYAVADKQKFYNDILSAGGEGVVLKYINSVYHASESRYHRAWIKVKRTVSGSLLEAGYGDTLDGFVIGWERGNVGTGFENLVGGLKIGINLIKEDGTSVVHWVATVSNLELEFRKRITLTLGNLDIDMDPSIMGKVVEIDGQVFSARSHRLTHPRLIRFREDKSPSQCTLEEKKMKELVL